MGLLTNPNEGPHKWVGLIAKFGNRVGFVAYFAGLLWLGLLANVDYNMKTYFSENALLPGLVVENFGGGHRAETYLSDLIGKKGDLSAADFYETFRKIGLDEVEVQNFTLIDPLLKEHGDEVKGTNVFAVLRAKRAAGTEALVFNAPFFPKHSETRRNLAGIALMFALAEYFQNQVYWAKDIVFLISEAHIGTLAWVKGHQEMLLERDPLKFERVRTKAGNIQAAVNVIMEGHNVCSLETKFHGINGQLPNLDFVNLLNKFIVSDAQKRPDWEKDFWKLVNYMKIQGTGTPTGSHGFFLKYGIESVTLTGKSSKSCKAQYGHTFGDMGRILEAVFRSLNNLLERLHQSFFFYLKTTPNRFISISLYFPPLALIVLPMLLRSTKIWLTEPDLSATGGLFRLLGIHSLAIFFRWSLGNLDKILELFPQAGPILHVVTDHFPETVLLLVSATFLFSQLLLSRAEKNMVDAIYCFALFEFATSLYSMALFNPSLVIIIATVSSPFLTLLFFLEPKKRLWLWTCLAAIAVGASIQYFKLLQNPISKYFYESEVYGNFLFDFIFIVAAPVFAAVAAVV